MKLAVLSESPEDEAALRIIVDGILGIQTEPVVSSFRASGWSQLPRVLPAVVRQLHYHSDADALAIIVDSDNSATHRRTHVPHDGASQGCRLCKLRLLTEHVQNGLTQVPNRSPLKTAFGLAIPAIEAWLLFGLAPHINEVALVQRPDAGTRDLRLQLKRDLYGTDSPLREVRAKRVAEEAKRLVENLDEFELWFPDGFGSLAHDIRSW